VNRRLQSTGVFLGLALLACACVNAEAAEAGRKGSTTSPEKLTGRILITGSSTLAPVITEIGKRFETLHPGVQVEVRSGGSGRGISDATEGKADIGMASRALKDEESSLYSFAIAVENPNGIAYISIGAAERAAAAGVPIKLLPVDGVAATTKDIRSGNFPLSRPLLLLTKDAPTAGLVKEFVSFALSSQATASIEKFDFVPYLD
jgi:ABC-type phosphate transport system substrate-binding protein